MISIHAAREGGDIRGERIENMINEFQSTPPVKAATVSVAVSVPVLRFQSTPPVKAATVQQPDCKLAGHISIHAAREGGDCGNE